MCIDFFIDIIPFLCFCISILFFIKLEKTLHSFSRINEFAINKKINLTFFRIILMLLGGIVISTIICYFNLSELGATLLIDISASFFIVLHYSYNLYS